MLNTHNAILLRSFSGKYKKGQMVRIATYYRTGKGIPVYCIVNGVTAAQRIAASEFEWFKWTI